MINVLIADDHTIVRYGLKQLLLSEPDIIVVGEARNGNEVLETLRTKSVDVIVLDITMPGRNGLETLKELRRTYPDIAVIVLSMHPKDQYAVRVVSAGAAGYITKECAPDELVMAIRKSYLGERYISSDVAELLADFVSHRAPDVPHNVLSDRELEVFRLLASGKGITQISDELNLSVKTVSTYKSRIVEKTGLSTISEMIRYSIDNQLL